MYRALTKLDDIRSYANVLTYFITSGEQHNQLTKDWLNDNIYELEYYIKEYFSGDAEIIHEIQLLRKFINDDVHNLKGIHEMRTEMAKSIITEKINNINNLIKKRITDE